MYRHDICSCLFGLIESTMDAFCDGINNYYELSVNKERHCSNIFLP